MKYLFLLTGILTIFYTICHAFFNIEVGLFTTSLWGGYFAFSMIMHYYNAKHTEKFAKHFKGYEQKWAKTMKDGSLTKQEKEDIINNDLVSILSTEIKGNNINVTHKED